MHSPNHSAPDPVMSSGTTGLMIPRSKRFSERFSVAVSIVIYLGVVSMIPVWNKKVFTNLNAGKKFHYPLTVTCLQLGACSVILAVQSAVKHFFYDRRRRQQHTPLLSDDAQGPEAQMRQNHPDLDDDVNSWCEFKCCCCLCTCGTSEEVPVSWIFGPGLLYKLRKIFVIGFCFGFKYGLSNWGLDLVPTPTHLLLQATDMFWSALFAIFIAKESIDRWGLVACLGTIAGSVLIAIRTNEVLHGSFFPLVINLTAPVLLGICIATLRTASMATIVAPDPGCGFRDMGSVEFTAIKLAFSATTMIPFVIMFEVYDVLNRGGESVMDALHEAEALLVIGIFIGSVFVALFQANITWLSSLTSAITVGLIGGVKVVPQWIFSLLFQLDNLDVSALNVVGATLVVISVGMWGYSNYKKNVLNAKEYH